ncbi:MAG: hypothetical protein AB1411_13145 [Nitrospirota bacterium]
MSELLTLWDEHRNAGWPRFSDPREGELMTLDTVISGCVTFYLESEGGLDQPRVEILESCLADLEPLLPNLPDEAVEYFARLQILARLLLEASLPT